MINPNKRLKTNHVIDLDADPLPRTSDVTMPEPPKHEEKPEMPPSKINLDVPDVSMSEPSRPKNAKEMSMVPRPNEGAARPMSQESPVSEPWRHVFQLMETLAPRVGNLRIDASHEAARLVQAMVPHLNLQVIYVCRGTERFQLPLDLPDRNHNSIRHTVCIHRSTEMIHDFGFEDWLVLKRARRIRAAVPSKLMITSFGTLTEEPKVHAEAIVKPPDSLPRPVPEARGVIPRPVPKEEAVVRASGFQPPTQFDGWAPPPIAIQGPKFRDLEPQERADLKKLHTNLGHPDPNVLAEHLKAQNAPPHVVAAAREFVCDACVESVGRKHQRPAKLHEAKDFNDLVGMDGFYWSGFQRLSSSCFSLH